jgi:hypothetical protein
VSELTKVKTSATWDISALEVKVALAEARAVDDAAAAEKHLVDFRMDLTGDLVGLREAYERNIQSLGGICLSISDDTPLVKDYACWLTLELRCLPRLFASVNENFVLVALEGILVMLEQLALLI